MKRKKLFIGFAGAIALLFAAVYFLFFAAFNSRDGHAYLYIDDDDTYDSVCARLDTMSGIRQLAGLRILATLSGYRHHVRPGRYDSGKGISTTDLFRNLRNGSQAPVKLTIHNIRTMDKLAARLGEVLMVDSAVWARCFSDSAFCAAYGTDTALLPCLFIPNTYEVYWNIKPDGLLRRMQRESEAFWTPERMEQADAAGLTPDEVIIMASMIVDLPKDLRGQDPYEVYH